MENNTIQNTPAERTGFIGFIGKAGEKIRQAGKRMRKTGRAVLVSAGVTGALLGAGIVAERAPHSGVALAEDDGCKDTIPTTTPEDTSPIPGPSSSVPSPETTIVCIPDTSSTTEATTTSSSTSSTSVPSSTTSSSTSSTSVPSSTTSSSTSSTSVPVATTAPAGLPPITILREAPTPETVVPSGPAPHVG